MKKITKVEKVLIASNSVENYITYMCEDHGVFQQRKDVSNGLCPYCNKQKEPVKDIKELQAKYRQELGWDN